MNKEKFFNEVEELTKKYNVNKEDLEKLFRAAAGEKIEFHTILVDKIVKDIFGYSYTNDILVPWNFYDTEVGKAILNVKFGYKEEEIYFVSDMVNFTGYTKQFIGLEIKSGNLKAEKRGATIILREKNVNEYLIKKGFKLVNQNNFNNVYEEKNEELKGGNFEREESYLK